MNSYSEWRSTIDKAFSGLTERLGENLPNFIGALLLIFAGWLVGKLLRAATVRLIHLLDHAIRRLSTRYGDRPGLLSASADVLGSIVFWVTVLFFLTAATQVLGLDAFLGWLNRVVAYLPTLLTGGLIVLVELNPFKGTAATQKPLATVSGTIHMGLALTVVLYAIGAVLN